MTLRISHPKQWNMRENSKDLTKTIQSSNSLKPETSASPQRNSATSCKNSPSGRTIVWDSGSFAQRRCNLKPAPLRDDEETMSRSGRSWNLTGLLIPTSPPEVDLGWGEEHFPSKSYKTWAWEILFFILLLLLLMVYITSVFASDSFKKMLWL